MYLVMYLNLSAGTTFISELVKPIFTKDGEDVKVKVAVKFLDNETKFYAGIAV